MTDDLLEHFEEAAKVVIDESQLSASDIQYLQGLGTELQNVQAKLDTLENERKLLTARKQELSEVLIPDAMRAKNLVNADTAKGKFHLPDGSIVYLKKETYASVSSSQRLAFIDWLREHDIVSELMTTDFEKRKLNEFSKKRLASGQGPPKGPNGDDLVTMYTVVKSIITKGR
jgi:hypothetical protein